MRKLITVLVGLVSVLAVHSQQKDPPTNFGKVTLDELKLKECDFEKTAGAMVLFDVAEAYGSFNIVQNQTNPVQLSSEVERHVRIKIFNEKGFRNADVHIIFWNQDQEIKNLEAQTYNLDESGKIVITKLEKKLVYERKLVNKFISEQSFTFPDLRDGTVIEYKYKIWNKNFGIQNRWNFQGPIPVKFGRFEINFPEEFVVTVIPKCSLPLYQGSRVKDNRTIESYVMENVPSLNPEPFMTTPDDYLQHVEPNIVALNYQGMHTNTIVPWIAMIRELVRDEDFGGQLKKDIPRIEELEMQLKKLSDPYQKMTTIYYYVRSNMTWDGINTIWAPKGIKEAWKDKKGTAGEINLILVNLLKDAGINAHAVLVSTKDNGKINAVVADMRQFNKVMAYVTLGENIYILDGTDKFTPPTLIPLDVSNTQGLLIADIQTFAWGWKKLWNQQQRFKNYALLKASINEKDELTGTVKITSMDYAR
ncbi:MAG TPA: DUF3857 domain-containing protein, partial [Chitinophagaceae bacterium]|nr:DUF3857 domain-containing protein [Chitinophagaceae bacterium]